MSGPVELSREEAQAVCDLVNTTFISETAREVYESEAFDSAMTKLDALASGDPSPSPIDEAADTTAGPTPDCDCASHGLIAAWRHSLGCPYGKRRTKIEIAQREERRREEKTGLSAPEGWEGHPRSADTGESVRDPSPSLPAEPSGEAIALVALELRRGLPHDGSDADQAIDQDVRELLRAAYRIDGVKR